MKIEFICEEPFCRYNGILMDEDAYLNLFGIEGEIDYFSNKVFMYKGILYSDLPLKESIKLLGTFHKDEEESFVGESRIKNSYVIPALILEELESIEPTKSFYIKYPKFNKKEYNKFMKCLDDYYKSLRFKPL